MAATILKVIDLVIGTFFNDKITNIIAGINKKTYIWKLSNKAKDKELSTKVKGFFKEKNK